MVSIYGILISVWRMVFVYVEMHISKWDSIEGGKHSMKRIKFGQTYFLLFVALLAKVLTSSSHFRPTHSMFFSCEMLFCLRFWLK